MSKVSVHIEAETCTGCMVCKRECPVEAISGEKKKPHEIDQEKCVQCLLCFEACRFGAIFVKVDDKELEIRGSKKKKDDIVPCPVCGGEVGTRQRIGVLKLLNPDIPGYVFELCPDCRRTKNAELVAVQGRL